MSDILLNHDGTEWSASSEGASYDPYVRRLLNAKFATKEALNLTPTPHEAEKLHGKPARGNFSPPGWRQVV
ncbi:MAG: hypothetical protein Q7R93_04285 [bacterium]|nr:hypothetical protein [bacterium]